MRRVAPSTALAALALATVPAAAAGAIATLTVDPNEAGKPSRATLNVNNPRAHENPRTTALRVVRGARFDPRARAVKCSKAQADANQCPAKTRIGGGTADVTVSSPLFAPTQIHVPVDLYLMRPLQAGDLAGVVAHFRVEQTGQEGHSFGRVTRLASGPYGMQTRFTKLNGAVRPPSGVRAHVDHLRLTFGAKRTVMKNGAAVTYHLIHNPKTCDGTWEYQVAIGYGSGDRIVVSRSGP